MLYTVLYYAKESDFRHTLSSDAGSINGSFCNSRHSGLGCIFLGFNCVSLVLCVSPNEGRRCVDVLNSCHIGMDETDKEYTFMTLLVVKYIVLPLTARQIPVNQASLNYCYDSVCVRDCASTRP